jgi:flagellar motility protein MotE (MotC chaperone)
MKSSMSRVLVASGLAAAALTVCVSIGVARSQVGPAEQAQGSARVAVPVPPAAGTVHAYAPGANNPFVYGFPAVSPEQAQAAAAADQKTRELVAKYSQTENEDERAKIVEQLTSAVGEQFEAKQEARQQELKRLEEQLKKLRQLHDRRASEKSQIIEDRVKQLLRDADGLGWGADDGHGRAFYAAPLYGAGIVREVQGFQATPPMAR